MKLYSLYFLVFLLSHLITSFAAPPVSTTHTMDISMDAGDVAYTQLYQIDREVDILKRHFHITQTTNLPEIKIPLKARHVWQKTYEVLYKLNLLRHKHGLVISAIAAREPQKEADPFTIYEQASRILTEISILKVHLGIKEKASPPTTFSGKTPNDRYNLLNHISYELDLINGATLNPSNVYSQAMRIDADVQIIMGALGIHDDTVPPPKKADATPTDSIETALQVLNELIRIKVLLGLDIVDVNAFKPNNMATITPTDVFTVTGAILAELQPLKFHLKLNHILTPTAEHYEDKVSADSTQVLGWMLRKLQLIRSSNK